MLSPSLMSPLSFRCWLLLGFFVVLKGAPLKIVGLNWLFFLIWPIGLWVYSLPSLSFICKFWIWRRPCRLPLCFWGKFIFYICTMRDLLIELVLSTCMRCCSFKSSILLNVVFYMPWESIGTLYRFVPFGPGNSLTLFLTGLGVCATSSWLNNRLVWRRDWSLIESLSMVLDIYYICPWVVCWEGLVCSCYIWYLWTLMAGLRSC